MQLQELKAKFSGHGAFAKNSVILFGGSMVANVLNYVYHLVIGRQVSAGVYGEAESIISLITIISVPAATLTMVAVKYAAECKAEGNVNGSREIWRYLNQKVLKFGLPILLCMVILTPTIGRFLNMENNWALIAVWVVMYISFFNAINNGLLSGWQKFKKISFASASVSAVKLISGILLVRMGFALGGIVGSLVLSVAIGYGITSLALRFNILKKTNVNEAACEATVDFAALKKFILPVFVGNLAITILGNADMVLAKHSLDDISAGQYGALTVVSKIIFFGTGVIASVLFSMSSESSHKGNSSKQIFKTAISLIILACGVATAIYFLFPTLILSLLYGSKYAGVSAYLGYFAISVSLFSLANVIFQYLLSRHQTRIVYALLAIALSMVLSIVLFGETIMSIVAIVIGAQVAATAVGIYYLARRKTGKK